MKKVFAVVSFLAVLAGSALPDAPPPKESEFVFARVEANQREWRQYWREAPWHHDYPFSDEFFPDMLEEVTGIRTSGRSYHIVQLESPEIFNYPFLYISEPGFFELNEKEIANLGEYVRRGGFIMLDDFRKAGMLPGDIEELDLVRYYFKRALPEYDFVQLTVDHPVFNSFYKIDTLNMPAPYAQEILTPEFWGLSDSHGTLRVIANYNNDLGEFWEWVDKGEQPFHEAALSVKLGINYVVYAMSH